MNFGGTLRLNKFACFSLLFFIFLIIYWHTGGASYPDKGDLIDLKALIKASIRAAELGGAKVLDGKNRDLNIKSKGKTKEGANDPVTDADYASHCAMYYGLQNTFPGLIIVSEEHSKGDSKCEDQPSIDLDGRIEFHMINSMMDELVYMKDVTVWIDPLDATQEYTEALYQYVTTMVCVAISGVPIMGVIHYPFVPATYWGWYTKRNSMNMPFVEHKEDHKEHPTVIVSRSHAGKVIDLAKDAYGDKVTVLQAAGAGYKVMTVVNGTADVYLHATAIKKWDLCAGDAILKSVGGRLTTSTGRLINYTGGSDVKVSDGIIAARYDHEYYMRKIPLFLGVE